MSALAELHLRHSNLDVSGKQVLGRVLSAVRRRWWVQRAAKVEACITGCSKARFWQGERTVFRTRNVAQRDVWLNFLALSAFAELAWALLCGSSWQSSLARDHVLVDAVFLFGYFTYNLVRRQVRVHVRNTYMYTNSHVEGHVFPHIQWRACVRARMNACTHTSC